MGMGRAWVFGDRVDTDVLAPGALMKLPPDALARQCLKALRPDFADAVRPGDFVVAGESFGVGSSREQAVQSLKLLGVAAVIAVSFARIFHRNAFNLALPALICADARAIGDGDRLDLDLAAGRVRNTATGREHRFAPVPAHLMSIVAAGGLMAHLKAQRAGGEGAVS